MKTSAPTMAPGPRMSSTRKRKSIPAPAANMIVASQSRWATQSGDPTCWRTQ